MWPKKKKTNSVWMYAVELKQKACRLQCTGTWSSPDTTEHGGCRRRDHNNPNEHTWQGGGWPQEHFWCWNDLNLNECFCNNECRAKKTKQKTSMNITKMDSDRDEGQRGTQRTNQILKHDRHTLSSSNFKFTFKNSKKWLTVTGHGHGQDQDWQEYKIQAGAQWRESGAQTKQPPPHHTTDVWLCSPARFFIITTRPHKENRKNTTRDFDLSVLYRDIATSKPGKSRNYLKTQKVQNGP